MFQSAASGKVRALWEYQRWVGRIYGILVRDYLSMKAVKDELSTFCFGSTVDNVITLGSERLSLLPKKSHKG